MDTPSFRTESLLAAADFSPWNIPGPSYGLVSAVGRESAPYPGAALSQGTLIERDITSEKAASGPRDVVFPWFLPYFDPTTLETTPVQLLAFRQMLADPRVKTAILGKLFGVASLKLRFLPADKNNKRDQAIAQHVDWMLNRRLRDGVAGLVWTILIAALCDGYSVSEKVWSLESHGKYAGKYSLTKLKSKDTNNDVILQTDSFRNVVGVQGLRYNGGREFSPAHFLIYRHLPLYDNPTGMSDLRAAYSSYWMLDTVTKLRAIACEKYTLPVLIGHYQNTTTKSSLEAALKMLKSQRWASAPETCRIEALEIAGGSEEHFKSFVMDLRHDIFLSIQGATLQSLEGETTDGRGNSQVHATTSDKFVWFLARSVETLLNDLDCGLIKDCVDLNYVVSEYPAAVLDAVDVNELQQEIQVDTALHQLGLDLSRDELYERYGRKPPENENDRLPGNMGALSSSSAAPGGSGALPFADQDLNMPAQEEPAYPFRRFSEEWQRYLFAAS